MTDLICKCPGLSDVLDEMLGVSDHLWQKGWAERNAGNLSVDVTDLIGEAGSDHARESFRKLEHEYPSLAGRYFLVTGSGRRFRDVSRNAPQNVCILQMSEDGGGYLLVWGGEVGPDFRPTSEFPTHLRLHEFLQNNNSAEKAVLHTHPPELIVLTHLPEYRDEEGLNRALWGIHPEVKINLPKGAGFVPYGVPGSEALAQASVKCFRKGHAVVLWEMHGCVARAKTPMEAFDLIDITTKAASMVLMCRSVGHMPTGLDQAQLDELVRTFNLKE